MIRDLWILFAVLCIIKVKLSPGKKFLSLGLRMEILYQVLAQHRWSRLVTILADDISVFCNLVEFNQQAT